MAQWLGDVDVQFTFDSTTAPFGLMIRFYVRPGSAHWLDVSGYSDSLVATFGLMVRFIGQSSPAAPIVLKISFILTYMRRTVAWRSYNRNVLF